MEAGGHDRLNVDVAIADISSQGGFVEAFDVLHNFSGSWQEVCGRGHNDRGTDENRRQSSARLEW